MSSNTKDPVRPVTAEEAAFFRANGWVKLERLVAPEVAVLMRELAEKRMTEGAAAEGGKVRTKGIWNEWRYVARDAHVEPFASATFSPTLARNHRALLGRNVQIRYWNDVVACKVPAREDKGSGPTGFHQDFPHHSYDRCGSVTFWIALDKVTPEGGAMQFVSQSNRDGPLGRNGPNDPDLLQQYPELLQRRSMSPPLWLDPGDATCHDDLTVHGAPANNSSRPRWSYLIVALPGDALYNGASYVGTDGLGLKVGQPFDHPLFQVIG